MNPLTSIIVDDEWLVRKELKLLLAQYPEITLVGEAENVTQALALVKEYNPDVIFLDIQMPGETGFDLLDKTDIQSKIVFVTAYDQYALRAFDVNALDYLLKPIQKDRLSRTIERLLTGEREGLRNRHKLLYEDIIYVNING